MIKIEKLCKSYTQNNKTLNALIDIDTVVEAGDIFGFIGLSGAGKTSLVRCISALEKADSGSIIIDNVDITKSSTLDLRKARRKIGMVFQHFNLLMNSTVFENVAFPLNIIKMPKDEIEKKVTELLDTVGLLDKKYEYPSKLSGGQKQRVGIARALAADPSLVICDEATSALDPSTTKSILALIKDINKKYNMTFIIITHEMDVIKSICNKVSVLEAGKIIESGSVVDVFVNPKTDIAKQFFNTVNTDFSNKAYKNILSQKGNILKLTFVGDDSPNPYISHIITNFNITVAILSGNIQPINDTVIGCLVIKVMGDEHKIKQAINYLEAEKVYVEEVLNV